MIASIMRSAFISLGIASLLQFIFSRIQSDFVYTFLNGNITNLQVALLALNGATLSIVLTKIRELTDKTGNKTKFEATKEEMLLSIKEQVFLIATSLLIVSFATAKNPPILLSIDVYQALLLASFVYSLLILYDTSKSIFIILDY